MDCDCPCGVKYDDLDFDLVEEVDGSLHDVIDCPECKTRLYYED